MEELLHILWGKAKDTTTYNKKEWLQLQQEISNLNRKCKGGELLCSELECILDDMNPPSTKCRLIQLDIDRFREVNK